MLPAGELNPENGVISSSSSRISDPPPQAERNTNYQLENRIAIDILDESFSEIIKKEDEDEEAVTLSDDCSTNCAVFPLNERKRLHSPSTDEEEEDGNPTVAVSAANKLRPIHEEEEGGNQENNNGEEKGKRPLFELYDSNMALCSRAEEHRENAGLGNNVNNQNSEQNEGGNQESGGNEGEEDGEEYENQEENDEEEKRRAAEKGKRPMSEICKLKSMELKFSKFEKGEPSDTPEGNQTPDISRNDDIELIDHQNLAILKSVWHFNSNNGYIPYPHSDELHNHIMDSIPNFEILGEDLTIKIEALRDNFNTVRELDGDYPEMARPIDQEIFDLSMRLWGNVYTLNRIAYSDKEFGWYSSLLYKLYSSFRIRIFQLLRELIL